MKKAKKQKGWMEYYEDRDILKEITDDSADLVLDEELREEILSGKRKRKLKNVTIKVDPLQIMAIKKLSTMKSIPYQTLVRQWLAEGIKHELDSVIERKGD
jgi:predicted DNA binding CopG/RHH family protein